MANRIEQLCLALRVLASNANEQLQHLARIGHFQGQDSLTVDPLWNIDELGLEFGDAALLRDGMLRAGEISQEQHQAVAHLDSLLESWSGQAYADFWTVRALQGDSRWETVRAEAKAALSLF